MEHIKSGTEKAPIKLPVRSALIPIYYKKFHCLAQGCKDSCCVNWSITFDKKDYLKLRRLDVSAELKEKLETYVRRERKRAHDGRFYGKFDLGSNHGSCPFLNEDGLCSIQLACGEDALPYVCKTYPRSINYSFAAKEYSLSPSCEGVLQQLWELPEGVEFVEDPLPNAEQATITIPEENRFNLYFEPVRAMCVDILQNRDLTLPQRMLYLGIILKRLLEEDWNDFDPDAWTAQMLALADSEQISVLCSQDEKNRRIFLMQNLKALSVMNAAGQDWSDAIYMALEVKREVSVNTQMDDDSIKTVQVSEKFSTDAYMEAMNAFDTAFLDHGYFFENLMVAAALYMRFPVLSSKEELWKSYVSLCNLYSFYRFAAVLGCKGKTTKEQLFHMLVMASRATLHNRGQFNKFRDDLFQNDSSTLAHMAILLSG